MIAIEEQSERNEWWIELESLDISSIRCFESWNWNRLLRYIQLMGERNKKWPAWFSEPRWWQIVKLIMFMICFYKDGQKALIDSFLHEYEQIVDCWVKVLWCEWASWLPRMGAAEPGTERSNSFSLGCWVRVRISVWGAAGIFILMIDTNSTGDGGFHIVI